MEEDTVFQTDEELARLDVQSRMMARTDRPVYEKVVGGRSGLCLLDVGCSDGAKTVDRFALDGVARVVGLERIGSVAQKARQEHGGGKFSFFRCDVEAEDFPDRLREIMAESGVRAFDIINLSHVLQHLADPGAVLERLRPFLAPDGQVVIIEADDALACLEPDPEGLFAQYLRIMDGDPYSGDRRFGGKVEKLLRDSGYCTVRQEDGVVRAGPGQTAEKRALRQIYCSIMGEDVALLLQKDPENPRFRAWKTWLAENLERLCRQIEAPEAAFAMGVRIFVASAE